MKTIKGPGIFLAQFAGDKALFNSLDHMAKWASDLGSRDQVGAQTLYEYEEVGGDGSGGGSEAR